MKSVTDKSYKEKLEKIRIKNITIKKNERWLNWNFQTKCQERFQKLSPHKLDFFCLLRNLLLKEIAYSDKNQLQVRKV